MSLGKWLNNLTAIDHAILLILFIIGVYLSHLTLRTLFKFYDEICIPPQQNVIETVNLIQNIDRQFGYIRSNFGYLPMSKIGSSKYLTTSSQGHNIIISCHQGKTQLGVYGFMSIYEPDPEIDPEKKWFIENRYFKRRWYYRRGNY